MKLRQVIWMVALTGLFWQGLSHAFASQLQPNLPRVMLKEQALHLMDALNNASLQGRLVQEMAIEGIGEEEGYLLRVLLEEVGSQLWDLHLLRMWSQNNDLILAGNRSLVFTDRYSNSFEVFDKGKFVSLLLRSPVYAKIYEGDDVLDGEIILFQVRRFSLLKSLKLAQSRDFHGYLHQYVLDLSNGERELISYRQALNVLKKGAAGLAPKDVQIVTKLNQVEQLRVQSAPSDGQQTSQFGLELAYRDPVKLKPHHYRFQLREQRGALLGALNNYFNLEIVLPNAVLLDNLKKVDKIGFLKNVKVVNHPDYPSRLILSARIAPDFLTSAPNVTVQGNTVRFDFIQLQDLTVFDTEALAQAEQYRKQILSAGEKDSPVAIRSRARYNQHIQTALSQISQAGTMPIALERFQLEVSALLNLVEASKNTSNELELISVLKERDRLAVSLTKRMVDFAEGTFGIGIGRSNSLLPLLRQVEPFAVSPELQQRFQNLIGSVAQPRF